MSQKPSRKTLQSAPRRNGILTSPSIKINVTQEVIDSACKRDSSHCMIAEAIKSQVPEARHIAVDLATIRFTDLSAGVRYVYLTPRAAQSALLDFDQGKPSDPFSFRITGAHVLPTGAARKAKATLQPNDPRDGERATPTRVGGQAPPMGPLAGGAPQQETKGNNNGAGQGNRTGKRREFGIRAIIR